MKNFKILSLLLLSMFLMLACGDEEGKSAKCFVKVAGEVVIDSSSDANRDGNNITVSKLNDKSSCSIVGVPEKISVYSVVNENTIGKSEVIISNVIFREKEETFKLSGSMQRLSRNKVTFTGEAVDQNNEKHKISGYVESDLIEEIKED